MLMDSLPVIISEAAREDPARQSNWYYHKAGADTAERYLAAFDSATALLAMQPETGTLRKFHDGRLRRLRSVIMFGAFRVHLIFYRAEAEQLVIFRVLHGMRDLPRRLLESPGS